MKRRDFVTSVLVTGLAAPVMAGQDQDKDKDKDQDHEHGGGHDEVDGKLSNATVSFGNWKPTIAAPLDRFPPNDPNPRTRNGHQLIPHIAKIKVGGTVNFVIGGFHNVNVYAPGTQPTQINANLIVPGSTPPGLIDDPNNRVYRGLDPRTQSQDRVEVVSFQSPGMYLVICGVRPHFVNDGMFGFVNVVAGDDN
jgi:plastocyanin